MERYRTLTAVLAVLALVFGMGMMDEVEDVVEVTLVGKLTCAKCELGTAEACQNALVVGEGEGQVVYLVADNAVSKEAHKKVCTKGIAGVKVTGTIEESEAHGHIITASKIEFPEA